MSGQFDNEQTDKEMMERVTATLEQDSTQIAEMAEAAREAELDAEEAAYSGLFPTAEEPVPFLSRAEERRFKAAAYKRAVLKNAKYSWKAAQERADQLERIYMDLLKQGRIGR